MKKRYLIHRINFNFVFLFTVMLLSCGTKNSITSINSTKKFNSQVINLPKTRLGEFSPLMSPYIVIKRKISLSIKIDKDNSISLKFDNDTSTIKLDNSLNEFLLKEYRKDKKETLHLFIYADRNIPFVVIRYLETLIRKKLVTRVYYMNYKEEFYPAPLSGLETENELRILKGKNINLDFLKLFNEESINILERYGIDSIFNPEFEIKTVWRSSPENQLVFEVSKKPRNREIDRKMELFLKEETNKKSIVLKTNDKEKFGIYFRIYSRILHNYYRLLNNLSLKKYGKPQKELEYSQYADIHQKIPIAIFIERDDKLN